MEGQGLKTTFLVSEKIVKMGRGGRRGKGEGHASNNNCEYKWKKEREYYWMSELTSYSGTADTHISIPSCILSVLIFADQNPKLFHYTLLMADKPKIFNPESSTETFISGLTTCSCIQGKGERKYMEIGLKSY